MRYVFPVYSALFAATIATPCAHAFEVYDDDVTKVSIGGWLRPILYLEDSGSEEIGNGVSRINIGMTRALTDGWSAFAKLEWGLRFVDNDKDIRVKPDGNAEVGEGSDSMFTRLGYVGARHDRWGSISIGKQWSSYYTDISALTDQLNSAGGKASGAFNFASDGGSSGTGRPDQAIQYNNSFDIVKLSVQAQFTEENIDLTEFGATLAKAQFDNAYGATLMLNFDMFNIGVSFNEANIEIDRNGDPDPRFLSREGDDKAIIVGASFGKLSENFYAAAIYSTSENHEIDNAGSLYDAEGTEVFVQYRLDSGLGFYAAYNHLEEDDSDYGDAADEQFEVEFTGFGAFYDWTDTFKIFLEFVAEDSTDNTGKDVDDLTAIGVKFVF